MQDVPNPNTNYFLQAISSAEESEEESVTSLQQTQRKTAASKTAAATPRRPSDGHKKSARSASSDSSASTESTGSSSAIRSTGAPFTTEEVKQKILAKSDTATRSRASSASSAKDTPAAKPFQSRFLNKTTTAPPPAPDDEETETTSEEETDSEEESDETAPKPETKDMAKTDIGPLLARSANARDSSAENTRKTSRDETSPYTRSKYAPKEEPKYTRTRPTTTTEEPSYSYTSRFLNKSKSSAAIPPEDDDYSSRYGSSAADDESKYPASGRSRYMALKERRQRLARSRSSQQFGDDDDVEEPLSPTSTNPTAYLASRGYGSATSGQDLSRSRSSHTLKSRDNSPERSSTTATTEKDGAALSSWARYLKNKYGNRSTAKDKDSGTSATTPSASSSSAAARRLSLGLPLRSSTELASSDDDSKNMQGSPTTPTAVTAAGKVLHCLTLCLN